MGRLYFCQHNNMYMSAPQLRIWAQQHGGMNHDLRATPMYGVKKLSVATRWIVNAGYANECLNAKVAL